MSLCIPHASGDEPNMTLEDTLETISIPHASGDEPIAEMQLKELEGVYPTRVGMNRTATTPAPLRSLYTPREWG